MSSAKSRTGTLFQNGLATAIRICALAATLAPAVLLPTTPALAQPSTSGGNLPYIATGQSEDEIQQRKRARAEADERARQEATIRAAEDERARQDAARVTAQPEPTIAPSAPAPAVTATVPPTATTAVDPAKAKTVSRPRPADLPPGVSPNAVAAEPRAVPPQQRTAAVPAQPQHGVVVVRRPMFFGLFGPEVNVTERVVILTPPANIGSTQASPRPPAPIAAPRVVRRPAENCHYHTRQAPGMGYAHGDIQCHWHQDPNHPSLRYVD